MQNKLYNINNLISDLQGDMEAVTEMLKVFLEFAPLNLEELNKALEDADYKAIASVAHKMKYSISNYGIDSLKDDILSVEILSKQHSNLEDIKIHIDKINIVLNMVFECIKQEIK